MSALTFQTRNATSQWAQNANSSSVSQKRVLKLFPPTPVTAVGTAVSEATASLTCVPTTAENCKELVCVLILVKLGTLATDSLWNTVFCPSASN